MFVGFIAFVLFYNSLFDLPHSFLWHAGKGHVLEAISVSGDLGKKTDF